MRDRARDTGAMKLVRKHHVAHLHLFDGMHRFVPSFLQNAGLSMTEIALNPRKRFGGTTKYSVYTRGLRGIKDLYAVKKILKTRHA